MPKVSAGLLMYRVRDAGLEVFLIHPGGPFWAKKDLAAWTIPKGEVIPGESALATAKREFEEETGVHPQGPFVPLTTVKQKGGKTVQAWVFEGDCDPEAVTSDTFVMEWPPRSGQQREFPEVNRAAFFRIEDATLKINPAQVQFLAELERIHEPRHRARGSPSRRQRQDRG